LRSQASAICARTAVAAGRVAMPQSTDDGGRFLTAGVAAMRPALAELHALKPPSDLRGSYDDAMRSRAQELALIEGQARAVERGGDAIAAYRTLQTQLEPLTRIEDAAWRALQIPACLPR
jgi:hypothetical protein